MNRQDWIEQENERLRAIAIQAKRLLLSDEIPNATTEAMNLGELVERYEEDYSELPPKLKPYSKKSWYARLDEKGQVTDLREILALSDEDSK